MCVRVAAAAAETQPEPDSGMYEGKSCTEVEKVRDGG